MIIYLIRHAHVRNPRKVLYGRLPGYPLSLKGRKAAKRVGRFLRQKNIEIIFASPLQRTLETAEFIQQKIGLNVPIETSTELLELNLKKWEGKSIKIVDKELTDQEYLGEIAKTYQGETLEETGIRVKKFILNIIKENKYKTIAIVSHRDPLLSAIWQLAEKPLRNFHEQDFPRGGVYKLVFKKERLVSSRLIYSSE